MKKQQLSAECDKRNAFSRRGNTVSGCGMCDAKGDILLRRVY